MIYKFVVDYTPTDPAGVASQRVCSPTYGDGLSISIDRAEGEWYYTRNLDGKLVFVNADYEWIMACDFDGTFTLNIKESHDNGATFHDYFTGTFSRASLEIDQDNRTATLNGLKEGVEDLIKNGKNEDYDLMKLIPNSYAKEVQGQVPPALAMVDYRSKSINQSNIYYGSSLISSGYKTGKNDFDIRNDVRSNSSWLLGKVCVEAKVTMANHSSPCEGTYIGYGEYYTDMEQGPGQEIFVLNSYKAHLRKDTSLPFNQTPHLSISIIVSSTNDLYLSAMLFDGNDHNVENMLRSISGGNGTAFYSPTSFYLTGSSQIEKIEVVYHYIRATLLTTTGGNSENVLDTGDYYKRMEAFNNQDDGLVISISNNTSDQPNGHRIVPGTDDYGGTPQYFAPPDNTNDWIPLAEDNWNFASMWYKITPSVTNGLDDPAKFGSFRWTRCWTIGCCIMHLLKHITNDKVVFSESTDYSQFLYGNPNPVEGHEPFQWLVTQKSNVMSPAATGASRCIVRLEWFLELLRNAFNCYYRFEKRNDGRYDFRIEHVEYFRRGGAYNGDLADQLDLTRLKPVRNFLRNGQPAKHYADQTNRYTFDLDGIVEKYTYSWQGDGGSDDFKGNPMYFRAGWIEKGSSEDHQVDNIFADLDWLMLNAGTDTASSKNHDGLFIFGGYQPFTMSQWKENAAPMGRYLFNQFFYNIDIWATVPAGQQITVEYVNNTTGTVTLENTYTGTGSIQQIQMRPRIGGHNITYRVNFGTSWQQVVVHRVHALTGNVYNVPNVRDLLRTENTLQNGVLAWPWLQVEYLHYDIPAAKWTYRKDEYTDNQTIVWEETGTIKMVKKQNLAVAPVPNASTEEDIMGIMGVKTGLGTGIIDNAKINLSSRNAEMTIIYDINPQN